MVLGPREPEHALELGHGQEQGTVGVALAQHRVDLEHRPTRVGVVDAPAVVDDAFEDGCREDAHRGIMTPMADAHELPGSLRRDATDPGDDPAAAEARGLGLLAQVREPLLAGLGSSLPRWLSDRAGGVLAVWRPGALDDVARAELAAAADAATVRVVGEVAELLALDPAEQMATPMTIVRTAHREPGAVLAHLGVPHVARDPFEERANPDDVHALAPPDLAAVDPELGPLLLAWGMGKATVLRARAVSGSGGA